MAGWVFLVRFPSGQLSSQSICQSVATLIFRNQKIDIVQSYLVKKIKKNKSKFNWHMKMEQSVSEVLLLILEVMMVVCLIFGHDPSMTCSYRSLWQAQITQWLLSQKWTLSWPVTTDISAIGRLFMGLWIDSSVQNHWHMLNHLAIMSRASKLLLGNDGR